MSKRCNPFKQLDDFAKSTAGFWMSAGLAAVFIGCVIQEIRHGTNEADAKEPQIITEEQAPENDKTQYSPEKDRHRVTEPFPVLLEQTFD